MSFDAHNNFAYSTIATAPAPAASGTSLVVAAGDGTKFPAVPFNATIWPVNTQPSTSNAEIVRVTNITTDTFTITRAQESSAARTVIVGDQIAATITAKTLTDVEAGASVPNPGTSGGIVGFTSVTTVASSALLAANAPVIGGGAGATPTTITKGNAGQVLAGGAAAPSFIGGATLLYANTGTDTTAAATTVDSIALSGLTAKDTIVIYYSLESVTQQTADVELYDVTDSANLVSMTAAAAIAGGGGCFGQAQLQQRQGTAGTVNASAQGMKGGARADAIAFATLTAGWTSSWTLGIRHAGVTAGGTFKWVWAVYRLAGQ